MYSYRQPELVKPVFDAFTSATGIGVNVTYLNKGLIERLKSEGSRSPADLVFTVDIARLKAVVEAGVTQPVDSEILSGYTSNEFKDPENNWFALTLRGRVVYASKDRVKSGEVSTYEDLADPKWKGKICTRPGTHPYNLALFSAMIAHHGEDFTRNWLQAVKDNLARKPQGNDRAQVKAIWAGECDISLGNTYYMGKMLQDESQQVWANSVRILFPIFESGGTHMNVSGMAMTKSAPNRENAKKLMEFLVSATAQKIYAETNFEYPIDQSVETSDLVGSWGEFNRDSTLLSEIAALRPVSLRLVEEVGFDF